MGEELQHPGAHAAADPDRPALVMAESGRVLTYGELEDRSCRVAHLLRSHGCEVGSHVAVLFENRPEYFEVVWGALRAGILVTPINWHLSTDETRYIVEDCGARVLFASSSLGQVVAGVGATTFVVGGALDGAEAYEEAIAAHPPTPLDDQCEGQFMFYSSGTTGRPKGIVPAVVGEPIGARTTFAALVGGLYGGGSDTVYLSPAPLHHAAPSGWTTAIHRLGGTVVVMERFDPVALLAAIERYRVTHVQLVPTHLVRLMKLAPEARAQFDLSTLRVVVHAAAPCPPEVKRAAMDWLGPVIHEYYSGSEGVGFCAIGPEEWLAHPGSVGRSLLGPVHIVGPDGTEVPPGQEGTVYFEPPGRFAYHGDPAKTAEAFHEKGWGTLGDIGRVDDEGYLYLTDRVSNMVISGGVNVYPREIEDVLILHPAVADVAVVGVPDADLVEAVRAVVQPADGVTPSEELAAELIAFCRERIAAFKAPKTLVFLAELPRLPTGKLLRRQLPTWVTSTT